MTGLKELRKAAGLTLQGLGDRLGVTKQAVASWEAGLTWPAASLLPALAEALGCSIDDLFGPRLSPGEEEGFPAEISGDPDDARETDNFDHNKEAEI